MKKFQILALLIFTLAFFSHKNSAAELITNGGFETGSFSGWTVSSSSGNGWFPWQVTAAGGGDGTTGGISASSPFAGTRSAWNGFCCNSTINPEFIYQDVTLPAAQTASLSWADRIQSNLTTFCSVPACGSNTYRVQILNPTTNAVISTLYTVVANGGTNTNTGWVFHSMNISGLAGQTVRLRFSTSYTSTISGHLNGPGRAEIDAVSLQSPAVTTSSNVTVGGQVSTDNGSGISKVLVTLTDSGGNSRTAFTNSLGKYVFSEVPAGETYILSVSHRKYLFTESPRVVNVQENISNADFRASP